MALVEFKAMTAFRYATLVVNRLGDNLPFTPGAGPNGGDFFLPWRSLRERFFQEGIELNTRDVNVGKEVVFELHLNAQRQVPHKLSFAYLYEDPIVRPLNSDQVVLARYQRVFTSNETLIDNHHVLKLGYPNDLALREVPSFAERDLFCVLIAANKALLHPHPNNLHHKRVEVIQYFEQKAPDLFALFGHGWDIPAVQPGVKGRIIKRLNEWRHRLFPSAMAFTSYRGPIRKKSEVLDRAKFSICYENSRGSPGYLTEKIFDCFTSGCVPVYIGTTHREHPIPADCYIDGDQFSNSNDLQAHLELITPERFQVYQQKIANYLVSEQAQNFTNAHWCDFLVSNIMKTVASES